MLVQRLVRFLDYNAQQYISTRHRHDFTAALARLENMRKLVSLIKQVSAEGRDHLSHDVATHVLTIQRHLHALHILPPDEMPSDLQYLYPAP